MMSIPQTKSYQNTGKQKVDRTYYTSRKVINPSYKMRLLLGHKLITYSIMDVRLAEPKDSQSLINLIAQYRSTLNQFRGGPWRPDPEAAERELEEYVQYGNPIFVSENDKEEVVAYLVCRVHENIVWVDSLFVSPDCRRMGYGTSLFLKAESLAREKGNEPVYNWVHPNNDRVIAFLKKRGYSMLNLVELRKTRPGEQPAERIKVGKHTFDY